MHQRFYSRIHLRKTITFTCHYIDSGQFDKYQFTYKLFMFSMHNFYLPVKWCIFKLSDFALNCIVAVPTISIAKSLSKFTALKPFQLFGRIRIRLGLFEIYWYLGFSNCNCKEQVFQVFPIPKCLCITSKYLHASLLRIHKMNQICWALPQANIHCIQILFCLLVISILKRWPTDNQHLQVNICLYTKKPIYRRYCGCMHVAKPKRYIGL